MSKIIDDTIKNDSLELFTQQITQWCKKYCMENYGVIQPEVYIPTLCIATASWGAYILESKAICHYRKPASDWRQYLEKEFIPNLKSIILESRNIAIDRKMNKQKQGDRGGDGDIPPSIKILEHYSTFDARAIQERKKKGVKIIDFISAIHVYGSFGDCEAGAQLAKNKGSGSMRKTINYYKM